MFGSTKALGTVNILSATALIAMGLLLSSCASVVSVDPLPVEPANVQISPATKAPSTLPRDLVQVEGSPFVFVHADHASSFAANMIVPLPFVTDAVVNTYNQRIDVARNKHYITIDANAILKESLDNNQRFTAEGGEYDLHMLIPIEECNDGVYRLSVLFQVEKDDWIGRYYYHLPTTIPVEDIDNPSVQELSTFRDELSQGIAVLMEIIDNEMNGYYSDTEQIVTVGSLYIVGSAIGGFVSPTLFILKNAQQVAATDDSVIVRIPGDPAGIANNGGMAYGLHYFRRDQLHTYEIVE